MVDEKEVPEKFRRYYRLLLELRNHVLVQLGEHTEETLLKSSKDDSGDLSGYGQHMADAGTDTFDRDFALSLVSSEQEALSEIEAAIKRVHAGTYGICESTQKPISKDRLLAVPFTRYSTEAKKQVERHSHRSVERGGLFGDGTEEDGGKLARGDDDSE
jgi:RNA polymerase-binding transcription factor DksA